MDPSVRNWLCSTANPPIRYLATRDLVPDSDASLDSLKQAVFQWRPVRDLLARQQPDGSFRSLEKKPTAMPTFRALGYLHRCGLDGDDEPVARALDYLWQNHCSEGAASHNRGGSGVLPCYVGLVLRPAIEMAGVDHPLVATSLTWIARHQRYDHRTTRAGGDEKWRFRAVENYGCWKSVSCYHGVVGTMRALAAVPPRRRSKEVKVQLQNAIAYLAIHRGYMRSTEDEPLFKHMTQFFLTGGYRFHLIDVLEGLADADRKLARKPWVRDAVAAVDRQAVNGRIPLVKNYKNELIEPLPLEPVGKPSRFLTYQWLRVKEKFGLRAASSSSGS